jgi:tRNA U34 5-methylaminomethyl-2-thiouridine-forming methyltransferase MnmC
MQIKREIITTGDGSKTIHMPEWNENYHSSHGALQEANHVFLRNGWDDFLEEEEITIFEVGFGTGLNAILTLQEATKNKTITNYYGIEAFPVSKEEIIELNYESLLENEQSVDNYRKMHTAKWNEIVEITSFFRLNKIHERIQNYSFLPNTFDLIYFDAFGPRTQEEMWHPDIFKILYNSLKVGGLLVTYCAKGQVKRDLKSAGFKVQAVPGPPGKREMTKAFKTL